MNTSISAPDTHARRARPARSPRPAASGRSRLSWGAATDNVGVARYNVHRSTTAGLHAVRGTGSRSRRARATPTRASQRAPTTTRSPPRTPPATSARPGTRRARSPPPTRRRRRVDHAPRQRARPSAARSPSRDRADNGSVAGVQFKLDGANLGAEDTTAPYSISWDTFSVANGSHTLTRSPATPPATRRPRRTSSSRSRTPGSPGLVAAWASTRPAGRRRPTSPATETSARSANATVDDGGKFDGALSFNGTNAWVTVPDSASLDLTTGMTLEAWVRPTVAGGWRTAIVKEQPGNLVYGIYANTNGNRPGRRDLRRRHAAVARTARRRCRSARGAISRRPTTARRCGSTSTARRSAQLAVAGSIATSSSALRIGGNGVWGEWFNGPIDEVRIYNRALSAAEIQTDMNRSVTPGHDAADDHRADAGRRLGRHQRRDLGDGDVQRADGRRHASRASSFQLKDAPERRRPGDRHLRRGDERRDADAAGRAAVRRDVHRDGQGRRRRRHRPRREPARRRLDLVVHDRGVAAADPRRRRRPANPFGSYVGEILRNEGLNAFTTIDVAFLSPALLSAVRRRRARRHAADAAQVTTLTGWVNGGGNLIAMRPDKQLAGLLGLTDAGTTLANAYLQVDTAAAPGAGIVGSTIQFHGTADRYTLNGATAVATLYSNATTATTNPAVTLRSVGSSGGQAAAFTYDLARSVVYTRQGNPAWAGQERDGVGRHPPGRPVLRRQGRRRAARLGRHEQDRDPAGRRAAAAAREPDHADGARQDAAAALLVPAARREGRRRDERRRPLAGQAGGTAADFDRYKALSPAGCSSPNWECVRSTSYIYPNSAAHERPGGALYRGRLRGRAAPARRVAARRRRSPSAELAAFYDTQLGAFAAKYTSVPAPVTSRTHCVYWPDWASNAKVELAHGIRLDANYYHYPGRLDRREARLHERRRLPDALRRHRRHADRRLPGEHEHDRRVEPGLPGDDQRAARQRARPARATTAPSARTCTPTTRRPTPAPRRSSPSAQARGVPVISYKQLLDLGRRPQQLDDPRPQLERRHPHLHHHRRRGRERPADDAADPGPTGTLTAITRAGSPVTYTVQTIKGIQYAMFTAATGAFVATYS